MVRHKGVMDTSSLRVAVIAAHPRKRSYTIGMAEAFATGAREAGAEVVVRDLYRLRFDPRLKADEIPDRLDAVVRPDVAREREAIGGARIFAFFYPLWFNATPAMMKGYIDRVFGMDFGYTARTHGGNQPLLGGRRMVTFTSTGAPHDWVERSGAWAAMQSHFDRHFAAMTGMEILGHHNVGSVGGGMRREVFEKRRQTVAARARSIVASCRS